MNATHITIKKVSDWQTKNTLALITFFVTGIFVGSGIVLISSGKIPLSGISPRLLLGAVINADQVNTEPQISSSPAVSVDIPEASTSPIIPEPIAQAPIIDEVKVANEKVLTEKRTNLSLRISDRTIAIERLNQEIERVKNASVSLIAEFNQNCGSWTDDCAKPYSSKLEANNTTYNELVQKQTPLSLELSSLKSELASLSDE